jgi:hypothetical protein
MHNKIVQLFLEKQHAEATAFAEACDLLKLVPASMDSGPPDRYLAIFRCRGFVREPDGVAPSSGPFVVGIHFPPEYLHEFQPGRVLTWLDPPSIWHPNIAPPYVCCGQMRPGTGLVELLYQIHRLITYRKRTMKEYDALNHAACQWARENVSRFPVDSRPLRRALHLSVAAEPMVASDTVVGGHR